MSTGIDTRGEPVTPVNPVDNTTVDIAALLERGRTLSTPVLKAAVGRLAPPMDTVAAYHFGWIDAQGRPADGDGGKAVRPARSRCCPPRRRAHRPRSVSPVPVAVNSYTTSPCSTTT